jgi:hypothetical protein
MDLNLNYERVRIYQDGLLGMLRSLSTLLAKDSRLVFAADLSSCNGGDSR